MKATQIDTAALRSHADRIEARHPSVAARARKNADRIDAERAAVETITRNGSVRVQDSDAALRIAEIWNSRQDVPRKATTFPLAGGWIVATGAVREASAEERARVACSLGYGPAVCTCGREDGKHGLLCALN